MELVAGLIGAACLALLTAVGVLALGDRHRPLPLESMAEMPAPTGTAVALLPPAGGSIVSPAGTLFEPWIECCRRLGIEYAGAPDEGVRAAVRYTMAVWASIHGPYRPAPPPAQRLAITLILANDALLRQAVSWNRALRASDTPLKDARPERDQLYRHVAAALA